MTVAHKERKKWIWGFTYNHHIQPSGGRECLPEDKSAFRDLIQRSGDIKMAFSRVMQKKKKRERERSYLCTINQDDIHHPDIIGPCEWTFTQVQNKVPCSVQSGPRRSKGGKQLCWPVDTRWWGPADSWFCRQQKAQGGGPLTHREVQRGKASPSPASRKAILWLPAPLSAVYTILLSAKAGALKHD